MTKRKRGVDYLKELNDLRGSFSSLDSHVDQRLSELVRLYPSITLDKSNVMRPISSVFTKDFITSLSIDMKIGYIQRIEEYLSALEKFQQLTFG
jgi:hypothetical protein